MQIANIAKNTSYFTFSLILQKIITFAYFAIMARYLIPDDLGKYYLAISFYSILIAIIDIGQANLLTREAAKDQGNIQKTLDAIMAVKLPLIIVSAIVVFVLPIILHYPPITTTLIYLSILLMIMDSYTNTFFAAIRGFHNLVYESIISTTSQLLTMVLGVFFIFYHFGLIYLMWAMIIGCAFRFFLSGYLLMAKWNLSLKLKIVYADVRAITILTLPFAWYSIFQKLYMYSDTIIISKLTNDYYTGLYQVPSKLLYALQFLPLAFMASLYPAFATYWKENRSQLMITFERGFNYLVIISLPISIGSIAIADKVVLLFHSDYLPAILSIQIMIASIPFLFLNFPIGALLNACDRQKTNTWIMIVTLIVSTILDFVLIPYFSIEGASFAVFFTNAFTFFVGMYFVPKIIEFRFKKIAIPSLKAVVAAIFMGLVVWFLKSFLNTFVVVALGGVLYFIALYFMGGFSREDVGSVVRSFARK